MNRACQLAFGSGLAVVGLTGLALAHLQSIQRLGTPGVQVVAHEVRMEGDRVIGTQSIPLPETVLDFQSEEQPIARTVVEWLPKDTTYAQRFYKAPDNFWIQANGVLMGTDRTSIHKPEYCLAGQGFHTRKTERDTIRINQPHPYDLPVMKMTVDREVQTKEGVRMQQGAIYVFWFVADQQLTADHNERMWWMARDLMTRGVLQRWAYISCFSVCRPGHEEEAYARVRQWIQAAVPRFQIATGPRPTTVAAQR